MAQYRFFARNGAKPWVIESDNLADAKRTLQMRLDAKGQGANADSYIVQEPGETNTELVKSEPQAMQQNIQESQKNAQEESLKEKSIPESLAIGLLKMLASYSVESMEKKGAVSPSSVAADMTLGALAEMAPIARGVGKVASLAGTQEIIDIGQQVANEGDVNAKRTAVGSLLSLLPVTASVSDRLKGIAEKSIANTFLANKAQMANSPPDYKRMLDENIFGGFGKYSGLNRIQKKLDPIEATMNAERASGKKVEIEVAREKALNDVNQIEGLAEEEREDIVRRINDYFDAEERKFARVVPEVSHIEAVPNPEFVQAQKTAEAKDLGSKGAYASQIAKIKKKPDYTFMDIANVQEPKTYVVPKDIDEWELQKVIEQPSYIERQVPISTAWSKKTESQQRATKKDIANIKGEQAKQLHVSRGWREAIGQSSPEATESMRLAAPYYAVQDVMENRRVVGGSNPVIGLKDFAAGAAGAGAGSSQGITPAILGFLTSLGISKYAGSPMAAQHMYNIGKVAPQTAAPLLIMQRNIPEYME